MNESPFFIPFCSHFFSGAVQTFFFVEITETLRHDKIVLIPCSMLSCTRQRRPLMMHVTQTSEISVYEYDTYMYVYALSRIRHVILGIRVYHLTIMYKQLNWD